jgi:phosphatidylglycerophosphate synthase
MTGMSRRPLQSRDKPWAKAMARWLAAGRITPNQISQVSVAFALIALTAFSIVPWTSGLASSLLFLLATVCIQGRLLCNLLDGMVAIEGGKSSPTGPFWNEAPDRLADVAFLWGAGLAAGAPALGLAAGAFAVATAYLRELGRAEGLAADFSGPMAKPHRMAALTVGCLLASLAPAPVAATSILSVTLWVILIGTAATAVRRSLRILAALNAR